MKLRLIIQTGSLQGQQYELEQGSLLLGRGADCAVRFNPMSDPGVSTHHAVIQREADGFYLVDQRSTNGTLVNGQPIQRIRIDGPMTIQLGNQGPQINVVIEALSATMQQTAKYSGPGGYVGGPPQGPSQGLPPAGYPPSGGLPPGVPPPPPPPSANLRMSGGFPGGNSGQRPATSILRDSFNNIGVYDPEKDKTDASKRLLGLGVGLGIGTIMALIVMVLMILSVGLGGAVVGTVLAFAPAPFYLLLFLWLDRYDPEPAWALVLAFAWGGLFAVIVSFIVNTVFSGLAMTIVGGPAGDTLGAVISAPLIEEGTKGLGVVLFLVFLRKEFDDILDGIVYAGVIALGFATVENVLYYGRQFAASGVSGDLIFILFLRGVLAPFSHSLFTAMTGIGCGLSRESHNKAVKIGMPIVGYLMAVFLHGLWNGIASLVGSLIGYFVFYIIIWVPLFLIMLGVMIYMAKREAKMIKEMLAIEVARGLITPQQLELVGSSMQRMKLLSSSLFSGNFQKLKAQRNFLRAVTKLAFCYWHVARASAANNQTSSLPQIPKFQAEVMTLKGQI